MRHRVPIFERLAIHIKDTTGKARILILDSFEQEALNDLHICLVFRPLDGSLAGMIKDDDSMN